MTPGYNFDEEARIVCEAIGSNNGRMTVHCALREAHAAGVATQGAEIARLRTAPWFLLYGGTSADGRSNGTHGTYEGRTQDMAEACEHLRRCRADLYSVGGVMVVTDGKMRWPSTVRELQKFASEVR